MNAHSKKVFFFLSAIMILFCAFRILNGNDRLADSKEYLLTADFIKNGTYFHKAQTISEAITITNRPFVYPSFLLLGFQSDLIIILFQNILGICNLYLALLFFQNIGGRTFGFIPILLVLLTPSVFIYTHIIMSEIIVATLLLLIAVTITSEHSYKNILCVQFLVTILVFTKPVFYLFAFVNVLFWLWYLFKYKKRVALTSLIPLLLMLGYMRFNEYRTGYFQYSSIQTINLINYNLFYYKTQHSGIEEAERWKDSLTSQSYVFPDYASRSAFLMKAGTSVIMQHPLSYGWFHLSGALRGMIDPGRFDLTTFTKQENELHGILYTIHKEGILAALQKIVLTEHTWLILALMLILIASIAKYIGIGRYILLHYKSFHSAYVFIAILVCYTIVIAGPLNASRFMMPLQLILIAFAAASYEERREGKTKDFLKKQL
ncbi:MAG: hypothetical protein H7259_01070 [Cytophagales bacterium]|nr:hypothetical protein [Cytophaga sp.]